MAIFLPVYEGITIIRYDLVCDLMVIIIKVWNNCLFADITNYLQKNVLFSLFHWQTTSIMAFELSFRSFSGTLRFHLKMFYPLWSPISLSFPWHPDFFLPLFSFSHREHMHFCHILIVHSYFHFFFITYLYPRVAFPWATFNLIQ